jgi:hypothetical protein
VAAAQAQAKQMLDEATARATAIHDGAERRLNLLVARHTETVRRLTEVRDVVTNLVAGEAARGSLEEEVARSVASAVSGNGGGNGAAAARPGAGPEGRHAPGAAPAAGSRPADGPANGPADAAARSHRGSPVPGERLPGERPAPASGSPSGSGASGSTGPGSTGPGSTGPGTTGPGGTPPGGTGPRSLPSERPAPAGSDRAPGREPAKPVRPTAGRGTPGSLGDRADDATGDGARTPE